MEKRLPITETPWWRLAYPTCSEPIPNLEGGEQYVMQWYKLSYPTCGDWIIIPEDLTFLDLTRNIRRLDVGMRFISLRHRVLVELSERAKLPYDWFWSAYLGDTYKLERIYKGLAFTLI